VADFAKIKAVEKLAGRDEGKQGVSTQCRRKSLSVDKLAGVQAHEYDQRIQLLEQRNLGGLYVSEPYTPMGKWLRYGRHAYLFLGCSSLLYAIKKPD
jgi:hypothetical protein